MKNSIKEWYAEHLPGVPKYLLEEAVSDYKADPCTALSNIVIFHMSGGDLVAHALHIYSKGCGSYTGDFKTQGHWIRVQNKYIFSKKDGYCRFTRQRWTDAWKPAVWREPAFTANWRVPNYPGSYGIYYEINDFEKFFFKGVDYLFDREELFRILKFLLKHPNAEYLFKQGFSLLLMDEMIGYTSYVNWKSNNLKTMLSLNKTELRLLQENRKQHQCWKYIGIRALFPKLQPELIINACEVFSSPAKLHELLEKLGKHRHVTATKLITYMSGQKLNERIYTDYIAQCNELKRDLRDSKNMFPHDFHEAHARLSKLIEYKMDEILQNELESRMEERKSLLFETDDMFIRLPKSLTEIYDEGKTLDHCVGGYAERHAKGKLTIVFLRLKDRPDVPYYTMEISNQMKIVQCYGFRNNAIIPKPESVIQFEAAYQQYLNLVKVKNERKKVS